MAEDKIEHLGRPGIICLSETWLRKGERIPIDGYEDHNYYVKKLHKKAKRASGGLSVYICKALQPACRIIRGNENVVWLELRLTDRDRPLAIGLIYIPPEGSPYLQAKAEDMFRVIEMDIAQFSLTHDTVLLGDFNAHTNNTLDVTNLVEGSEIPSLISDYEEVNVTDADLTPRQSQDKRPLNSHGKKLIDFCITTNHEY